MGKRSRQHISLLRDGLFTTEGLAVLVGLPLRSRWYIKISTWGQQLVIYSKCMRYHENWNGRWTWNDANLNSKSDCSIWDSYCLPTSTGMSSALPDMEHCAAMSSGMCFCCLLTATQILYLYMLFLVFHSSERNSWIPWSIVVCPSSLRESFTVCGSLLSPGLEALHLIPNWPNSSDRTWPELPWSLYEDLQIKQLCLVSSKNLKKMPYFSEAKVDLALSYFNSAGGRSLVRCSCRV